MAAVEIWIAVGTLAVAIAGHVVKSSVDKGKLQEKVENLEEWKAKEEDRSRSLLTIPHHDRMQDSCRAEIYRDMERIEDNVNRFISKLDTIEERRDRKEEENQRRIQEMHDAIVEINAYIKSKTNKIGVY